MDPRTFFQNTAASGVVNSGQNDGGALGTGDTSDGAVAIDGDDVLTSTSLDISADGGVAISDASGGDENVAFFQELAGGGGGGNGGGGDGGGDGGSGGGGGGGNGGGGGGGNDDGTGGDPDVDFAS